MNFLNRFKFSALAGILLVMSFVSCEDELTTIGEGVIGGEPFITDNAVYDVISSNKKIEAVRTNKLPVYQLGIFNDPVYGKTEARITSQLQLSVNNPTFGIFSQQEEDNGTGTAIAENETVTEVFLYIPYFNNQTDTDRDGVVDEFDTGDSVTNPGSDPVTDPTNDTDGDGVPNNTESANNTNPLSEDTDGDGINDGIDDDTLGGRFAEKFRLDSIYGVRTAAFTLKVERSTFFLRDIDPNTNFQFAQEYFSSQEFSPAFVDEVLFNDSVTISDEEILFEVLVDDPDTDENEVGTISRKRDPGIRVPLNADFFQQNILNKEGDSELLSALNFKEFMRGIHLSVTPTTEELLLLLDITNADIEITYEHDVVDSAEKVEKTYIINLVTGGGVNPIVGNAVNTFINDEYPADILNRFDENVNPSRIHLKGGAGSYAEIQLFNEGDITEIKANNWIINEANLVFYVDRDGVTGSVEPPRLYLFNAETNAPLYNVRTENSTSNTPLGLYLNYDGIFDEANLKYTVRITEHINNIVVRDSANAKLGLSVSPDIRLVGANNVMLPDGMEKDIPAAPILTPLSTVLHGSSSENDIKKLKLEIFYTQTN